MIWPFRTSRGRSAGEGPGEMTPGDMSLVGHLNELRVRLIRSVLAIVLGAVIVFVFFDQIFSFLERPYCELQESQGRECTFLLTGPLEGFSVVLSISGYGGLILAMPFVLYQLAKFVLPGLYPDEKKILLPFVICSMILFAIGIGGGYLLMPKSLEVLGSFGTESFTELFAPLEYVSFFVKMLLAFGIAAELPLVLIFLQLVGAVPTAVLRRNRRIAIVGVVVLAAVVTPTGDPFTLLVLAAPMYLSYEISLLIGGRMTRRRRALLDS